LVLRARKREQSPWEAGKKMRGRNRQKDAGRGVRPLGVKEGEVRRLTKTRALRWIMGRGIRTCIGKNKNGPFGLSAVKSVFSQRSRWVLMKRGKKLGDDIGTKFGYGGGRRLKPELKGSSPIQNHPI